MPPTNQSQIEFHLVEESHSFTTPDEDFFIITSIDGVKILDLIREENQLGSSAKPCANLIALFLKMISWSRKNLVTYFSIQFIFKVGLFLSPLS